MKEHLPQLLPARKGKTLRQKVYKEAETFEQYNLEVTYQRLSFLNPKSQTPCLPAGKSHISSNFNFEMTKTVSFGIFVIGITLKITSSPLAGEDGGEGEIGTIGHPHPYPLPSRERGLRSILMICG
jgi:hypothetical protein